MTSDRFLLEGNKITSENMKEYIEQTGGFISKERIKTLLCSLKDREKELKETYDNLSGLSEQTRAGSAEAVTTGNAEEAAKPHLKLALSSLLAKLAKMSDDGCNPQASDDGMAAGAQLTASAEEQARFAPVVEIAVVGNSVAPADEIVG
jgi:ribosomal protein L12E/L44/L45/RPP1/RPP2